MLFQTAQDLAYLTISDNETDQFFITPAQMSSFANKALDEIVESAQHIEGVVTDTTEIGQNEYESRTLMPRILRVEVDGKPIRPTTQLELRKYGHDWLSHTGRPERYYLDGLRTNTEKTYIGLYPASSAEYVLRVTYIAEPATVSLAVAMNIPEWCSEAVVWSMLADIYLVDTEIMNVEASAFYRYLFEGYVDRIRARSFSKLPKAWSYQTGPAYDRHHTDWDNFPEEIPSP